MGININPNDKRNYTFSDRTVIDKSYNTKVALWHLPYNANYLKYDTDGSKWFEAINKNYDNEIENAEENLKISLNRYKVHTKTTIYSDNTQDIVSKYPNGNVTTERHGINHVFADIKDKFNRIVAEKIFNYDSNEGRKIIYKHIKQGDNIFTIVRVYLYDTSKNRKTDMVNYGYTNDLSTLTKGCELEKEYYLLNGKEVKAELTNDYNYSVKDMDGNTLIFTSEESP